MLESMLCSELKWWQGQHEYVGPERDDFNASRIVAAVENMAGKSLKEGIWVNPYDLMPFTDKTEQEPIAEEAQPQMLISAKLTRAFAPLAAAQAKAREARKRANALRVAADAQHASKMAAKAATTPPSQKTPRRPAPPAAKVKRTIKRKN